MQLGKLRQNPSMLVYPLCGAEAKGKLGSVDVRGPRACGCQLPNKTHPHPFVLSGESDLVSTGSDTSRQWGACSRHARRQAEAPQN